VHTHTPFIQRIKALRTRDANIIYIKAQLKQRIWAHDVRIGRVINTGL